MTTATSPSSAPASLRRTPFYDKHVALGAKIVPFAGYEMPVQYAQGITVEHKAVRERAGLFDVSHVGEFIITGDRAVEFVNYVPTNDVAACGAMCAKSFSAFDALTSIIILSANR